MVPALSETRLLSRAPAALAAALAVTENKLRVRASSAGPADLVISAADQTFAVVVTGSASASKVALGAERATRAARRLGKRVIPVVAVPFMGESGKRACRRADVSWFDFSGNAYIVAPGIRVIVEGRPNRFARRGRPATVFAPKSSRVARWLLIHPNQAFTQRELAHATGVSEGFVSRIVARLEDERYVARNQDGALRVRDPQLMLDAWQDQYRFSKHSLIQGHVAARSGDALTRFVSDTLVAHEVEHAATGLAAAWQLTHFAAFRIATFYLDDAPSSALIDALGFREEPRGANLWLVNPNDAGVFHGAEARDGVRCVHPVQAYLDLTEHPERAAEAAERIRAEYLSG